MQWRYQLCLIIFSLSLSQAALADLNIFACEPEWASLVKGLGGNRVMVVSATTAHQDPHRIEARPSLIAKVRRADLLVCSGAELEIGWLPMLQRQAANSKVMPGREGHFEAAAQVERLGVPKELDRSMGDVHASGNPHVHLDPRRLRQIAAALQARMAELDPQNGEYYAANYQAFDQKMLQAIERWSRQAEPLRGKRFVVHHQDWVYLFDWLGMLKAGSLEPKPGLPTAAGHLAGLRKSLKEMPAEAVIYTHYQNPRAANRLSKLSGIPAVELPYTVGGADGVDDLFDLFDLTLTRLLEVTQ